VTSNRASLQRSIVSGVIAIASLLGAAALIAAGGEATAAPPITVGIDVDPTGNSPASLGTIDYCREVAEGQSFDIDIYIQDTSTLAGFGFNLVYEPSVLNVTAKDPAFLLGAGGLEMSEPIPDRDGDWRYAYAGSISGSGSGVLLRANLEAVGTGTSPLLLEGVELGIEGGLTFLPDNVLSAVIAVGEPCSEAPPPSPFPTEIPTPTPVTGQVTVTPAPALTPTPTSSSQATEEDTDDGFPWVAVYAGAGAGVAALVALGLLVGLVRRR